MAKALGEPQAPRRADPAAADLHQAPLRPQLTPPPCLSSAPAPRTGTSSAARACRCRPAPTCPAASTRQPGGVAQNIARALAALGRPVALLSAIGRDRAGDELVADLAAAGIDCAGLHRHDGPTDTYLAHRRRRRRAPRRRSPTAPASSAPAPPSSPAPRRPTWPGPLVLDGNLPAPVLAALPPPPRRHRSPSSRRARTRPPASPPPRRPPGDASTSTAARPRRSAPAAFPDSRAAAAALLALGAAEAVVTDGPRPATAAGRRRQPSPSRRPPVAAASVTGAGDVLVAAHLAARADGLDPEAALRAALAAAARHITSEVP